MSPNSLGRVSASLVGLGVVAGLITMAAPWLRVELPGGLTATGGWQQVSPVSWSVGLAAVAAWGAGILVRATSRRVLSILQSVLATVSLVLLVPATADTAALAEQIASRAVGIDGALRSSELAASWSWGWLGLGVVALLLVAASGITGALRPPAAPVTPSRYERSSNHPADPWEQLSEGVDPTD